MERAAVILFAFLGDLALGDPRNYPHPVRMMGWCIRRLEIQLPRICADLYGAGMILWIVVVGGTVGITWGLIRLGSLIHPWVGIGLSCLVIYTTIAMRDLNREARDVYKALIQGDIVETRKRLSRIVGRDTEALPFTEIVRATVESVAESTVDGIVSPLFFAVLGGAPLAMAFKATSTLDSMVGYKNERYKKLGWFSATMDDLMNYIPARITGMIIPAAAFVTGMRAGASIRIMLRDRKNTPSPNAGIPEASFAGALGITLGGISYYQGQKKEIPPIGDGNKEREPEDILRAIRLMYAVSFLFLTIAIGTLLVLHLIITA